MPRASARAPAMAPSACPRQGEGAGVQAVQLISVQARARPVGGQDRAHRRPSAYLSWLRGFVFPWSPWPPPPLSRRIWCGGRRIDRRGIQGRQCLRNRWSPVCPMCRRWRPGPTWPTPGSKARWRSVALESSPRPIPPLFPASAPLPER